MEQVSKACARLGIKPGERVLTVRIGAGTLQFHRGGALARSYPASTSRRPPSNQRDSLGTPRGLHAIAERIGAGQPPGMVFRARVPTGRHHTEFPPGPDGRIPDLITSRILRLRGLEPGVNQGGDVDTHARLVYIHGTNHGDRIGEPLSSGCVLLRDLDIIELHDEVRTGDLVWITD